MELLLVKIYKYFKSKKVKWFMMSELLETIKKFTLFFMTRKFFLFIQAQEIIFRAQASFAFFQASSFQFCVLLRSFFCLFSNVTHLKALQLFPLSTLLIFENSFYLLNFCKKQIEQKCYGCFFMEYTLFTSILIFFPAKHCMILVYHVLVLHKIQNLNRYFLSYRNLSRPMFCNLIFDFCSIRYFY